MQNCIDWKSHFQNELSHSCQSVICKWKSQKAFSHRIIAAVSLFLCGVVLRGAESYRVSISSSGYEETMPRGKGTETHHLTEDMISFPWWLCALHGSPSFGPLHTKYGILHTSEAQCQPAPFLLPGDDLSQTQTNHQVMSRNCVLCFTAPWPKDTASQRLDIWTSSS